MWLIDHQLCLKNIEVTGRFRYDKQFQEICSITSVSSLNSSSDGEAVDEEALEGAAMLIKD